MNPWQHHQPAGMFYSPVSSHYAQAYLQNTLGGFHQRTSQTAPSASSSSPNPTFQSRPRPKGMHKCTNDQCTFSGSQKAVEIHMMDRHLVYPPNYNKNKQRDWDTDPSLKGHVSTPHPPQQRVLTYSQKAHRHPGNQRRLEHARRYRSLDSRTEEKVSDRQPCG